jgi:hypothetical protein
MIITTRKVRRCRSWAYRDDGLPYRMQCDREAGHDGNHIRINSTTSWGQRCTRSPKGAAGR